MLSFRCRLRHLLALSLIVTALGAKPARADSIGLDFSLPEAGAPAAIPPAALPQPYQPLPIPTTAANPPVQAKSDHQPQARPANIYGGPDSLSLGTPDTLKRLPPPPSIAPTSRILPPLPPEAVPRSRIVKPTRPQAAAPAAPIALVFTPGEPQRRPATIAQAAPLNPQSPDFSWMFAGDSDSLVARTIGHAEGTRTADGQRTRAYKGHVDPGNGVWNLGTFSYQHGARSPEEADAKQLARLKQQGQALERKANQHQLQLSLEERLNGLDLANQSPLAALGRGGYIERLDQAYQKGLTGDEAILWARTHSYLDPDTHRWNAPGLGNTTAGVTRDQQRRLRAVGAALAAYEQQATANPVPSPAPTATEPPAADTAPAAPAQSAPPAPPELVSQLTVKQPVDFAVSPHQTLAHQGTIDNL